MDYCSSCRRHLNGALVCPGCGAYAPDIAPPGTDGHAPTTARSAHLPAAVPPAGTDTWFDDTPRTGTAGHDTEAALAAPAEYGTAAAGAADVTDAPRAPQGRAARRRQLARWKKSQRRAVVATAVALVGGGLTLASLDRGSGDRAQAATAPDNRSMGLGEEQPASPDAPATPVPSATPRHASTAPGTSTARTPAGHVAANAPRQQSLTATPRTAAPAARPDSIPTTPRPTGSAATSTPARSAPSTSTSASGTGTTANPASGGGTGTSGSTGSGQSSSSSSSPSSSSSSSSSSNQLCLVLVCLG